MWKEIIEELFDKNCDIYHFEEGPRENLIDKEDFTKVVLEFAKEVHDKACEEQKEICLENAYIRSKDYMDFIDEDSILKCPNARFE